MWWFRRQRLARPWPGSLAKTDFRQLAEQSLGRIRASEVPDRHVARRLHSEGRGGSAPLRNQKTALRVGLRSRSRAVMAAQRLLNLSPGRRALRARLTLPKQDKPLPADRAMKLGVSVGCSTQNLHIDLSRPAVFPATQDNIVPARSAGYSPTGPRCVTERGRERLPIGN